MKQENYPIDFVLPWVDGNDPQWKETYNKFKSHDGDNADVRFRDMDTLQYWFRGVEKFAPWVNKIFFVTSNQKPKWLNVSHPKLICINHDDFIPHNYLPTFSSHTIELNLHRIPELSEHFVYFNDDTFIVNPTRKTDFFKNGLPCQSAVINYPVPMEEPLNLVPIVNTAIINKHFKKSEVLRREWNKFFTFRYHKFLLKNIQFIVGKWFPGFKYFHQPSSFLKTTFDEIWTAEYEKLNSTCLHKFRVLTDVNQWLFQDWQICSGKFAVRDTNIGYYGSIENINKLEITLKEFNTRKYKLFCPNDNGIEEFELMVDELKKAFETILPIKSKFEL